MRHIDVIPRDSKYRILFVNIQYFDYLLIV